MHFLGNITGSKTFYSLVFAGARGESFVIIGDLELAQTTKTWYENFTSGKKNDTDVCSHLKWQIQKIYELEV